jgi:hypothetical protein
MANPFRKQAFMLVAPALLIGVSAGGRAHADSSFEISGHAQVDVIQDFDRVDPDWEAALRPSKIPTVKWQFGEDGQNITSVRQSKIAIVARQDVEGMPLMVEFDFDVFGAGDGAGQTHMRLQNFYGSLGPLLAGQTNTTWMDVDTFPNTIESWGPQGMVFIRNPQIRFTYVAGPHEFAIAVERPNTDIDPGDFRIVAPELGANIRPEGRYPDLTAHYRLNADWGDLQAGGILRQVRYETDGTVDNRPEGHQTGWGVNLSWNTKIIGRDVIHRSGVYGQGITSDMNDGGADLTPEGTLAVALPIFPPPVTGSGLSPKAAPLWGVVTYYDHSWGEHWTSSFGYSQTNVDNTSFQAPDDFEFGEYASADLLWKPDAHSMTGGDLQWGRRKDNDGATGDDTPVQFSVRYSFTSKDFF